MSVPAVERGFTDSVGAAERSATDSDAGSGCVPYSPWSIHPNTNEVALYLSEEAVNDHQYSMKLPKHEQDRKTHNHAGIARPSSLTLSQ